LQVFAVRGKEFFARMSISRSSASKSALKYRKRRDPIGRAA